MKQSRVALSITALAASAVAVPAFAHTGHLVETSGLLAGLSHPMLGVDHLLAMLAMGAWASTQQGSLRLQLPLMFLSTLIIGFVAGLMSLGLPMVETGIATSLLLLGLLLTSAKVLPKAVSLSLAAGFALFHGYAHGTESVVGATASFLIGFVASSLVLQLSGSQLAKGAQRLQPLLVKLAGVLVTAAGAYLLAA